MKLENYDTSKGGYIPVVRDKPELPELPEGYFFRISEWFDGQYPLKIAIRKKVLFWTVEVSSGLISYSEANPYAIARIALGLTERVVFERSDFLKYTGDYPPKKLGNSE